jgi:NADH-quinone oxidoreductase subunit A
LTESVESPAVSPQERGKERPPGERIPTGAPTEARIPRAMPSYVPILILAVVGLGLGAVTLFFSHVIGRPRPTPAKLTTYECGVPPIGTARERFPVKFFLVAMVFLLLDVDAAFLYPWALVFREIGLFGFLEMLLFIGILGGGFVYAWKSGALEW